MNLQLPTAKKALKAVKTQIRLKKSEIRQCRLCLRVVPRELVRETATDSVDLRRKILEAVSVQITSEDKLNMVCVSCLLLVDVVYCFRAACQRADRIHQTRLLMMHPGSWHSDETAGMLEACHRLVKRSRAEMEALYKCSGMGVESPSEVVQQPPPTKVEYSRKLGQQQPPTEVPPLESIVKKLEPVVWTEDISDGEPEMSQAEKEAQMAEAIARQQEAERAANRIMCEYCGKVFHKSSMEQHINRQHRQERIYACPTEGCSIRFFSKKGQSTHFHRMHGNVTRYECEICHKQLKGKLQYEKHLKTHGDETENPCKVPCTICGKLFYKRYIRDHMAVHTGALPYACEFCGRKFAAKNNWQVHRRKQHLAKQKNEYYLGVDFQ